MPLRCTPCGLPFLPQPMSPTRLHHLRSKMAGLEGTYTTRLERVKASLQWLESRLEVGAGGSVLRQAWGSGDAQVPGGCSSSQGFCTRPIPPLLLPLHHAFTEADGAAQGCGQGACHGGGRGGASGGLRTGGQVLR